MSSPFDYQTLPLVPKAATRPVSPFTILESQTRYNDARTTAQNNSSSCLTGLTGAETKTKSLLFEPSSQTTIKSRKYDVILEAINFEARKHKQNQQVNNLERTLERSLQKELNRRENFSLPNLDMGQVSVTKQQAARGGGRSNAKNRENN